MSTDQPDILVFLSDQHRGDAMALAGCEFVDTPNLDAMAAEGVSFDNASTSCPLCVPARMSLLTGHLPSRFDIWVNPFSLPSDYLTMAHCMGAAGYETVLCGRMHFVGEDQKHGFQTRLVGDFTPQFWGRGGHDRSDLGPFVATPASEFDKVVGGGDSPVLAYDRAVIDAALDYIARPRTRPLFMVIGIYKPHHSFVAPPELFKKYMDLVPPPMAETPADATLVASQRDFDPELIRRMRAAYYGMIEAMDEQFGRVRSAWLAAADDSGRKQVSVYLSDHGDQLGHAGQWGKCTFMEGSMRIPMIFSGDGIRRGGRAAGAVSITDLAPTLTELAGAPGLPRPDGQSLVRQLREDCDQVDRCVLAEFLYGRTRPARMARRGDFKLIRYTGGDDVLFNLADDPDETVNVLDKHPHQAAQLAAEIEKDWDRAAIVDRASRRFEHFDLLCRWGKTVKPEEPARWPIPREATQLPGI